MHPPVKKMAALAALAFAFGASAHAAGPIARVGTVVARPSQGAVRLHADSSGLISSELLAAFQSVASQNQCVSYTYDHNGNITAKVDQTFGASPTWGSSSFGCFTWTAP